MLPSKEAKAKMSALSWLKVLKRVPKCRSQMQTWPLESPEIKKLSAINKFQIRQGPSFLISFLVCFSMWRRQFPESISHFLMLPSAYPAKKWFTCYGNSSSLLVLGSILRARLRHAAELFTNILTISIFCFLILRILTLPSSRATKQNFYVTFASQMAPFA